MRFFSQSAVTLAPLLPLISATTIELSVSDSNSYEIGSQVELECNYHFVSHDGSKINQEEHEVTWFRDNTPIATASSLEDYQIFGYRNGIYGVSPNHNLEFSHEKNYENINSTEIISYTSKLTAANVEIANSGEYQCYVRLLKTQQILSDNPESRKYVFNAASSKISVFNKPSVSVVLASESFDLRPLELAGTLDEKFDVATCSVANAYPQPKLYEIVIGNRPIIEISADDVNSVSVNQNDETQLFDATIHISQQLFPTDNNAQIICIASSEEYSEKSEIVDQNINVLYFPAEVTVSFYDGEHQAVSYALVEDEIRVECGAESNPESKLELFEGEYVEPVVVVATEAAAVVVAEEVKVAEEVEVAEEALAEELDLAEESSPEYYDYDMEDNQELIEAVNQNATVSRKRRHQDEEQEEQNDEEIDVDEAVETIENLISEIVPEVSNETVAVEQVEVAAVEATQASVLSSTLAALLQIAEPAYAPPHKIYSAAAENTEQTYQCRATAFDENFSSFSKLSAVSSIPTIYLNTPILSISSENEDIDLLKPSVGDKIALSCGFAEGQSIGNAADFAVEYAFYQDGNQIASGSQTTEIVINKESAGDYSCAVSIPEIQRLQPQTSTNVMSLDVASACVFNPESKQKISHKSKTKPDGKILNTFTCNIIGDNCKVFWIYDKEHFGKGHLLNSKKQVVFTDMPAATEESGSISCYGKNEEGLSRKATLNEKFIKASEPESNSSMYLLGAVVVLAVVLFFYKKKGKKDQQKGEQVSLNSA